MEQLPEIKILADYGCYPLWDDKGANIDPSTLPLHPDTLNRLEIWQNTYNLILDWNDPFLTDFPTPEDAEAFDRVGMELWSQVQEELQGLYTVSYFHEGTRTLLFHNT